MSILTRIRAMVSSISRNRRGAIFAEYGILIAGIAAVVAGAVWAFGGRVAGLFGLPPF